MTATQITNYITLITPFRMRRPTIILGNKKNPNRTQHQSDPAVHHPRSSEKPPAKKRVSWIRNHTRCRTGRNTMSVFFHCYNGRDKKDPWVKNKRGTLDISKENPCVSRKIAVDLVLLSNKKKDLQRKITIWEEELQKWNMKVNNILAPSAKANNSIY